MTAGGSDQAQKMVPVPWMRSRTARLALPRMPWVASKPRSIGLRLKLLWQTKEVPEWRCGFVREVALGRMEIYGDAAGSDFGAYAG